MVGRRTNDVVIENLSVSRSHARIRYEEEKYVLADLNSSNGTLVNGKRIEKTDLHDGDLITVGKYELRFQSESIYNEQTIVAPLDETGPSMSIREAQLASDEPIPAMEPAAEEKAPEPEPDVAPASDGPKIPVLKIAKGKKEWQYQVSKPETAIGKGNTNEIALPDLFASKNHAKIIKQGEDYFIRDVGSWRGTLINGEMLKKAEGPVQLKENDEIQIGSCRIVFTLQPVLDRGETPASGMQEIKEEPAPEPVAEMPMISIDDFKEPEAEAPVADGPAPPPLPGSQPEDSMDSEQEIEFAEGSDVFMEKSDSVEVPQQPESESEDAFADFANGAEIVHDPTDPLQLQVKETDEPPAPKLPISDETDFDIPEQLADPSDATDPYAGVQFEQNEEDSDEGTVNTAEQEDELDDGTFNTALQEEQDSQAEMPESINLHDSSELSSANEPESSVDVEVEQQVEAEPEKPLEEEPAVAPEAEVEAEPEAAEEPAAEESPLIIEEHDEPPKTDADRAREVRMWERAMKNGSELIKKEAKRRLKKLTGEDYD